jgi:hypothetical protein
MRRQQASASDSACSGRIAQIDYVDQIGLQIESFSVDGLRRTASGRDTD